MVGLKFANFGCQYRKFPTLRHCLKACVPGWLILIWISFLPSCRSVEPESWIPVSHLLALDTLQDKALNITSRYLVLLFISHKTCATCNDALLNMLAELKNELDADLDFAIIISSEQTQEFTQLLRVGRVSCPIFFEETGSAYLKNRGSSILAIDMSLNRYIYDFEFPSYGEFKRQQSRVQQKILSLKGRK